DHQVALTLDVADMAGWAAGAGAAGARGRRAAPRRRRGARARACGRALHGAAAIALGSIASPGWVPADAAGMVLARRHSAAARWERAELAVHTNRTRRAVWAGGAVSGSRAPGISRRQGRRRASLDTPL